MSYRFQKNKLYLIQVQQGIVDKKTMIRKLHNRITHPAPITNRERDSTTKTALKLKQLKRKAKLTALSKQMATRLT